MHSMTVSAVVHMHCTSVFGENMSALERNTAAGPALQKCPKDASCAPRAAGSPQCPSRMLHWLVGQHAEPFALIVQMCPL